METTTEIPGAQPPSAPPGAGGAAQPPSAAVPPVVANGAAAPAAPAAGSTPDAKAPGADQKGQPAAGAEADKAKAGADIDLKFPDGITLDEQLVKGFKGWAKEHGVDSAKAQSMADFFVQHQGAQAKAAEAQFAAQQQQWKDALVTDKEFGGAQLDANRAVAAKAVDRFGGPELRKLLDVTGLGDHPALVRAFVKAGKAISEDRIGASGDAPRARASPDEALRSMYPAMFPTE